MLSCIAILHYYCALTERRGPVSSTTAGGGDHRAVDGAFVCSTADAAAVVRAVVAVLGQGWGQFVGRRRTTVGRLERDRCRSCRRHCYRGHVRYLRAQRPRGVSVIFIIILFGFFFFVLDGRGMGGLNEKRYCCSVFFFVTITVLEFRDVSMKLRPRGN